jgi:hypothetical protein
MLVYSQMDQQISSMLCTNVSFYIGGNLGGHRVKTVAQHFKRAPAGISRGIRKVEKKRTEERAFDSRVSRVEEAIKEDKKRKIVK